MTPRLLVARSGLARHTVLRALAQLESGGWLDCLPPPAAQASMPAGLLLDRQLGVRAKLIYGALQLTNGFRRTRGQFTYTELTSLATTSVNTVKQAVRRLHEAGWVRVGGQPHKFSPIPFTLGNPAAARRDSAVAELSRRLEEAEFHGEALMREYLSLIINSDQYDDNASPAFLVNPYTGEEMQFDRYYPPGVAFEYNGPQHYGPTARYPRETDARKREARDFIKSGICQRRGIRLFVLHANDLSLENIRKKVDGLLPLRILDRDDSVIAYLEAASRGYRRQVRADASKTRAK